MRVTPSLLFRRIDHPPFLAVKGVPGPVGGESPVLKTVPPKSFYESLCACFSSQEEPKLGAQRGGFDDDVSHTSDTRPSKPSSVPPFPIQFDS